MKRRWWLLLGVLAFTCVALPDPVPGVPVAVEFSVPGPLTIFGHLPVPQVNGFDYAITGEQVEAGLGGQAFTISRITLTADAVSVGGRVNFDAEIHLSGALIGLPAGQYWGTHIDPVAGYTRTAPSQFRAVLGDVVITGDFDLGLGYVAATNSASGAPALATVKSLPATALALTDGLHAQVFLWTADNRNVNIEFTNLRLVIEGDASLGFSAPVPEPATLLLLGTGLAGLGVTAWRRIRRK